MASRTGKAAGAEAPAQEMTPAAKLTWAKQAFQHLNAGEQLPEDGELLELYEELQQDMAAATAAAEAAEQEEQQEEAPEPPAAPELPPEMLEGLPPAVVAFITSQSMAAAAQAANTAKLMEGMFELVTKQAAKAGTEVKLEGDVDALVHQLSGTVSAGPPPENPLPVPVVFISKGSMFKAIRKPRYRTTMPNGEQFFTTGITYDFAPSGTFATVDPEAVKWLRSRPGFNTLYWMEQEPPFSAPDPSVMLERIIDLALALDDAGLAKLEEEEQASHKRPPVLASIARARSRVQGYEEAA